MRSDDVQAASSFVRSRRAFILLAATLAIQSIDPKRLAAQVNQSFRFVPPSAEKRKNAIGSLNGLSATVRRAFEPTDQFEAIPAPQPDGWLAEHPEQGQTYDQFVKTRAKRPDARRSTVYLAPFGDFDDEWSPRLSDLEAAANAFFQLKVKSLPAQSLDGKKITTRVHDGKQQYLSKDFLRLLTEMRPDDGFAILGITMQDLYPDPGWNYVFGQASPTKAVGVYSFARYDPLFWKEKRTDSAREALMQRSLGVLLHETCHMFGMTHCIFFSCLMNGANNLEESDGQPLHLCPVCLRKLHYSVGFDVVDRDQALLQLYRRLAVKDEVVWLEKRLKYLRAE